MELQAAIIGDEWLMDSNRCKSGPAKNPWLCRKKREATGRGGFMGVRCGRDVLNYSANASN